MAPIRPRTARRTALVVATVIVATGAGIPSASRVATASGASDDRRPNVLLIVTDDQRARGTLSVMPSVREWLARRGTRFERAFVTTPTCCPSRASIFTGMYAHNHGVHTSQRGDAENLDHSQTVQHQLDRAGYTTALFGKYLNGWDVAEPPPDFDRWGMFADKVRYLYRGGEWNVDGSVGRVWTYSTVFVQDLATAFIEEAESSDAQPWMMVLAPLAPHAPSIPQRRDRFARLPRFEVTPAMLEEDRSDKPPFARSRGRSLASIRKVRARQLRTLMSVDRMADAVRSTLADNGELTETLAFFTSDNGFMWGEHGLTGKGVAYEPAIHVPLLAAWPDTIPAGARSRELVANIDIAPTIYDAADITPSFEVDGRSLLDPFRRDRILVEHWERANRDAPNWAARRAADHKYIESYAAGHLVASWVEYYDLRKDPWELNNRLEGANELRDPGTVYVSGGLRRDLACRGTEGPTACP